MAKYVTEERFDSAMQGIDRHFGNVQNTLEGMATILQRLDQERIFTVEWIRRVEADVSMMKKYLKLA